MERPPNPRPTARDRWEERQRRQQEWARLTPEQKETILHALYGAKQRPRKSPLQLRLDERQEPAP